MACVGQGFSREPRPIVGLQERTARGWHVPDVIGSRDVAIRRLDLVLSLDERYAGDQGWLTPSRTLRAAALLPCRGFPSKSTGVDADRVAPPAPLALEKMSMSPGSAGLSRQQLLMYLAGCLCFSLGVKLFIDSALGVDPLHAMAIGIVDALALPYVRIGVVVSGTALVGLVLWSAWNRKLPPLSVFVTMALMGFLVDFWNLLSPTGSGSLPPWALLVVGLMLDAYGSALIIMSGVGIRIVDLLALTMMRKWGWRFVTGKLLLEGLFVLAAFLLGGPIGIATLAFVALVGPFVEPMVWVNRRVFRLPMHSFWPGLTRVYVTRGTAPSLAEAGPAGLAR